MNETVLIGKSEKFLSNIRRKKLNLDFISSLDGFMEIYQYLKDNLDELQNLKELMESKGYKAPYRSLSKYGSFAPGEVMVEEQHDVNRHNQYFRTKAAAKKNVLDRVKSAISSHKIALGHLEEFAVLYCKSCQKTYKVQDISNFDKFNCSCGMNDWELKLNKSGVFRTKMISHLPLSGDYMVKMSELTPWGRDSFKIIMKTLKQEKKGVVKTVSLVIKVMESGRWIRKRVSMDADDNLNYEKELRKRYGSNVRIEFLQFHRKKPTIINDRHTRTALALGYVKYSENCLKKYEDGIFKSMLHNLNNLKKYDILLNEAKNFVPTGFEELDSPEDIENAILDGLLKENKLIDSQGNLNPYLKSDIDLREKIKKNIFSKIPFVLILWDMTKYYLGTSFDRRTHYSGPFPNLRPILDRNQVKVFLDFDRDVLDVLTNHLNENIYYISNIQKVLLKKFEIEQKMKGLHMKVDPAGFGAAVLNIESGIDLNICADLFSVEIKTVKVEKNNINTMGKPNTKKAKKFLEMIKK
ncbi:DUF530 domain-containing protein [Methanobacterium alcaliphilum]|uniref:DUF530 domain-containing protein n=1 Tax=Methanobacterium alcaliphilum TaxID=392018 RepID=UPI00200A426B|nr:DUF530 domain-containing protein [Methanobacterium alcaliphilum]MCK9152487.1 DUF530 domain-containing protein [Methanobacterium alcaliphilum]